jgi:1-deoxy-D-xylulose-5-phosphate synthase
MLAENGIEIGVVNARFAKPIDRRMVEQALIPGSVVVTVEDHSTAGGFGSAVLETAQELGLDASRMVRLGMPADRFIAHGSRTGQLAECRIDASGIASTIQSLVDVDEHAAEIRHQASERTKRAASRGPLLSPRGRK